jgi:hypothetical protein
MGRLVVNAQPWNGPGSTLWLRFPYSPNDKRVARLEIPSCCEDSCVRLR